MSRIEIETGGDFAARLLRWHAQHGRHDLPWLSPRSAYRVWLSEVMLQQTQVGTVTPYFHRFVERFPDVEYLAAAPIDDVLALWSGLGYYARARNLHRAAQRIVREHEGVFPTDFDAVCALPGIGRSTAGAILAQAHGQRHAILDGNVKRVLSRHSGTPGWPGETRVAQTLWRESEARLPETQLADYTQAIMDLGATVCTVRAPRCLLCPVSADCVARIEDLTTQLPGPRPKRVRPQREQFLLLLRDPKGQLWFERRPPCGIWGGLWCLPTLETPEQIADWGEAGDEPLSPIEHSFTHFDLRLKPILLRPRGNAVQERAGEWLTIEAALRRGLPAPIRSRLQQLEDDPEWHAPSTASN
ncbi:A/G-specific adenine glycosylase [Algiphilus sp. W345]|uniref:Adenine DNA glycosylase n=1 Tax=Banduia mediterranea TaxID=3075609 RepID=A0ABU2WGZ5_9GAMM|nr:A/G-specific adenine glycosylase [Algiphilus sp. W345]MDT0497153.1 A/G-specific adenine glycosylase [Algiphilus sp. W345]